MGYNFMPEDIVILSDCATMGANCLASEVIGNEDAVISYSLKYHNMHNHIIKWYMQKRKEGRYTNPIRMSLIEHESVKAYEQAEMEVSWPLKLNSKVYNYSCHGNTFLGYLSDLKKHISKHGKPKKVIVTCFSPDHVYVRVNHNEQKYEGVVYQNWIDKPYNPDTMSYSKGIYEKKQKHGKKEYAKDQNYLYRKAYHSWYWLKKFLQKNEIDYFCVRYGKFLDYEFWKDEKVLDLSNIHKVYCNKDGDKSKLKLQYQPIIADKVEKFIKEEL